MLVIRAIAPVAMMVLLGLKKRDSTFTSLKRKFYFIATSAKPILLAFAHWLPPEEKQEYNELTPYSQPSLTL